MILKIGHRVRVRKDLIPEKKYGCNIFVQEMEEFIGKTVTIKIKSKDKNEYRIEEESEIYQIWWWTSEMFEGDIQTIIE